MICIPTKREKEFIHERSYWNICVVRCSYACNIDVCNAILDIDMTEIILMVF